ncbi:hypothetical protein PoB_000083100 [Plakobranchus ocellatus]|uniref:Uncharacterized protein n=1 Tax=Plakobranchus ocellatus TaxID=259542 RepID=A0AAV3XU39_9GAST|nr:hypothetical protein PoB_000083100 [Plakobranchus ocellatus]
MANYLIMPYAKNNQDSTPVSPMLVPSVGPTLLYVVDMTLLQRDIQYKIAVTLESSIESSEDSDEETEPKDSSSHFEASHDANETNETSFGSEPRPVRSAHSIDSEESDDEV